MDLATINKFLRQASQRQDLVFAVILLLVVGMFIIPLPTFLVDFFVAFNLTLAVLIVATATYLKNVLQISTFPSILLMSTIFRLALTISTTRLILLEGYAGNIIDTFGKFILSGNVVVGIVIFFIITIVNFIVITKGAERISEVSARFALDSLPGKQMAIDADLRNGDIDNKQARAKRLELQQEMQFFGSMDGAMRFVKGDAIAGLIILAVNLLGGLMVGMAQKGMSFAEAGSVYTILSIGDGLVSQLPAILISVAAGTIVTRVQKEDAEDVGTDMGRQLAGDPRALGVAAGAAFCLGALPGFPFIAFSILGTGLAVGAYFMARSQAESVAAEDEAQEQTETREINPDTGLPMEYTMGRAGIGSIFVVQLSKKSFDLWQRNGIVIKNREVLTRHREEKGFPYSGVFFSDDSTKSDEIFTFLCEGIEVAEGKACEFDANGEPIMTPELFEQIPYQIRAAIEKVVDRGLGINEANDYLDLAAVLAEPLVQGFKQSVPIGRLVTVGRLLLQDGLTLHHPRIILETMMQYGQVEKSDEALADRVRAALKKQIVTDITKGAKKMHVALVAPDVESYIAQLARSGVLRPRPDDKQMNRMLEHFTNALKKLDDLGHKRIVVTLAGTRRFLSILLKTNDLHAMVLSVEEVTGQVEVTPVELISFGGEFPPAQQPGQAMPGGARPAPPPGGAPGGPPQGQGAPQGRPQPQGAQG
jgi:type III secretion protein V